jgi:uncharacterized glyoxalase superfamily protein PhnB
MRTPALLLAFLSIAASACGPQAPNLKPYANCRTDNVNTGAPADLRTAPLSPELLVPDVDTGVAYYRDQLGFTVERNDAADHSCFAVVRLDDDSLLLSHVGARFTPLENQLELRFMVADVDATYARMKSGGAEFVRELATADYGLREYVVRDPYGVRLRFAMPAP